MSLNVMHFILHKPLHYIVPKNGNIEQAGMKNCEDTRYTAADRKYRRVLKVSGLPLIHIL